MFITFLDAIVEVDKIFLKYASFSENSSASVNKLSGVAAGVISGLPLGLFGMMTGAAIGASAAKAIGNSASKDLFAISKDKINSLIDELKSLIGVWNNNLSMEDQLTAYVAIINGCALYCVPKEFCLEIIKISAEDNQQFLIDMVKFIYDQLKQETNKISRLTEIELMKKYMGENRHHVISLYLFNAAISQYLPDEENEEARSLAFECYKRLPNKYQEFVLLKNIQVSANPSIHQYLLPQLERSSVNISELHRKSNNLDYFERQAFLFLRLSVTYKEAAYMTLSEKLQAIFDPMHYAYQAAESIYSTKSILQDFAHTYGNMKTSQLKTVAETLFKLSEEFDSAELRRLARITIVEVKLKQNLSTGIELMRMRCREDIEQLNQRLNDSVIFDENSINNDYIDNIQSILNNALKFTLYRILYDKSDRKAKIARNKILPHIDDWFQMCRSFEKHVIIDNILCTEWINSAAFPATLSVEISETWNSLFLYVDSFASVLLVDLLAELIFNALKYANYNFPIQLKFSDEGEFITTEIVNRCSDDISRYVRGTGLESRNQTMSFINGCQQSISTFVDTSNNHHAKLKLRKSLFFRNRHV